MHSPHTYLGGLLQTASLTGGRVALAMVVILALTTITLVGSSKVTLAADEEPVKVVSIQHEIDFGHGVDVRIEAEVPTSTAAITEVRAVFAAVGERNISSYAYPEFNVSPGTSGVSNLTADFRINTGGSAYYPPGTEFAVFFELTGTDNSITTTDTQRFLYLDSSKNWQLLSVTGIPLDFHYYGFPASSAALLADRVSGNWMQIAEALGIELDSVGRFRAVIYPDARELNAIFPPTSAASSDGLFFGGFAMERYGVFVLGGPSPDSVVHELTHLLIDTKVSSPLSSNVPSWLHEGLAQYFEAGSSRFYTSRLESAAASGQLMMLRNRNSVPALGNEIGLFYTQVGSFVGELIEMYGPETMAETLSLIDEGNDADDAVEIAFGTPLWQLENQWRVRLGANELPSPSTSVPVTTIEAGTTPVPQSTGTSQAGEAPGTGVIAEDSGPGDDEFNWRGPLIGAAIAAVVFAAWSYRVNRRRFRSMRRKDR